MTTWWCPLCGGPVPEPLWMDTARPVPVHLRGDSIHAIRPTVGGTPEPDLIREVVASDHGRLITLEPEGASP